MNQSVVFVIQCITFVIVKNMFHRFLALSVFVILVLGGFKGDSANGLQAQSNDAQALVEVEYWSLIHSGLSEASAKGKENKAEKKETFTFKFPNIFDVFRSLF